MSKRKIIINTLWVITIIATLFLMIFTMDAELKIPSGDDVFGNIFVMPTVFLLFIGLYIFECYLFINIKRIVKFEKINVHIMISSGLTLILGINSVLIILLSDLVLLKDNLSGLIEVVRITGLDEKNILPMFYINIALALGIFLADWIFFMKSKYRFNREKTERKKQRLNREISIKLLAIYALIMVAISCFFYSSKYEFTEIWKILIYDVLKIYGIDLDILINVIKVIPYLLFVIYIIFFHEKRMFRCLVPLALGVMLFLEIGFVLSQYGVGLFGLVFAAPLLLFSTKICLWLGIAILFKEAIRGFRNNDDNDNLLTALILFLMGKLDFLKPIILLFAFITGDSAGRNVFGYYMDLFGSIFLFVSMYIFAKNNEIAPVIIPKESSVE